MMNSTDQQGLQSEVEGLRVRTMVEVVEAPEKAEVILNERMCGQVKHVERKILGNEVHNLRGRGDRLLTRACWK